MEELFGLLALLLGGGLVVLPAVVLAQILKVARRQEAQASVLKRLQQDVQCLLNRPDRAPDRAPDRTPDRAADRAAGLQRVAAARAAGPAAESSGPRVGEGVPAAVADQPAAGVLRPPPLPLTVPAVPPVAQPTGVPPSDTADAVTTGPDTVTRLDAAADALPRGTVISVPQRGGIAPRTPRQPSAFETSARETLRGIWSWIVVGEEYRGKSTSVEFAVATNWLLRVGVLIVVFGVWFFIKFSSAQGWVSDQARVTIALLVGAGLIGGGLKIVRGRYHLLAQGVLGTGFVTLYGSIFAAANMYHLIGVGSSYALMVCVTLVAGVISVKLDSLLLAVLATVGGYGTPVALSTGSGNLVGLYGYVLLIGLGVLGMAHYRRWHLLKGLAFVATYGLVIASLAAHYRVGRYWEVMPFLIGFFVLFSTTLFIYQVLHREKATVLELLMLMANAGLFFGIGYLLTVEAYTREWCAVLALGLAAFYMGHVYLFLVRRCHDRGLALGFVGLSASFLILTVPLLLSNQWLTLTWSVQAWVLLWLSVKLNSRFLRLVAYLLYAVVCGRFFLLDLHGAFGAAVPAGTTLWAYLALLGERLVAFGTPILSLASAMWILRVPVEPAPLALEEAQDIGDWVPVGRLLVGTCILCVVMGITYLHLELNRMLGAFLLPARWSLLTVLWVAGCLLLLHLYLRLRSAALLVAFLVTGVAILLKVLAVDLASWDFVPDAFLYGSGRYSFLDAGMRLVDFGALLGFFLVGFHCFRHRAEQQLLGRLFGYGAIVLLFAYATLELNSFFACFVPGLRAGGLSVFWGLFALGLVLAGILRSLKGLRFAGLALFCLVALKVFLSDFAHLEPVYRIVAFILLGVVLLAGAFVYLKFQDRFELSGDEPDTTTERHV